jgi:hypothetical protein
MRTWTTGFCGGCGRCYGFRPNSGGRGNRSFPFWQSSAASPRPHERRLMEPQHERIARIALAAGARIASFLARS